MSTLGMRYFNVYGPDQDPSSPYSGVISRFVDGLREGRPLTVFGDGGQTRDFVYVGDVARANIAALAGNCDGVCNIGTGSTVTLLQLIDTLAEVAGVTPVVNHAPAREGDIRDSATAIARMRRDLQTPEPTPLRDGLQRLWQSF